MNGEQSAMSDNRSAIDRWFDDVQSKLVLYKQRLRKESTFKKFMNRKKGKLFRLRKKLKRLRFRAGRLSRQPTGENKRKLRRLDEIIGKVQRQMKQVKQDLRCLMLVKRHFTASRIRQELRQSQSKQTADREEFRRWRSDLIWALFGPREAKLRTRQQRRTRNYYRCASISLSNLIRVRSLWDRYLVDSPAEATERHEGHEGQQHEGSSIPLSFVLTDFQPNEQWAAYLGEVKFI